MRADDPVCQLCLLVATWARFFGSTCRLRDDSHEATGDPSQFVCSAELSNRIASDKGRVASVVKCPPQAREPGVTGLMNGIEILDA